MVIIRSSWDRVDLARVRALGLAVGSGAIMVSLLNELANKGTLTVAEIRGVLQTASNGLTHFYGTDIGLEAGRVIADLFAHFPEDRAQPRT